MTIVVVEPKPAKPLPPAWRAFCQVMGPLMLAGAAGCIVLAVLIARDIGRPDTSSAQAFRDAVLPHVLRIALLAVLARVLFGVGRRLARMGFARQPKPTPAPAAFTPPTQPPLVSMTSAMPPPGTGAGLGMPQAWPPGGGPGWQTHGGAPAATVVRVKCRTCGYLDSEDARFCSSCGKAL